LYGSDPRRKSMQVYRRIAPAQEKSCAGGPAPKALPESYLRSCSSDAVSCPPSGGPPARDMTRFSFGARSRVRRYGRPRTMSQVSSETHGENPSASRCQTHYHNPSTDRVQSQTANRPKRPLRSHHPCHTANRGQNRPARASPNRPAKGPDRAPKNHRSSGLAKSSQNHLLNRSGNGSQGDLRGVTFSQPRTDLCANVLSHSELGRRTQTGRKTDSKSGF
jgi:hypothetical protein